jgi:MFS family permease
VAVSLAQFMLILALTVVNVALPDLGADLDLSRTAFTWAVSIYVLFFGAASAARPPHWSGCSGRAAVPGRAIGHHRHLPSSMARNATGP